MPELSSEPIAGLDDFLDSILPDIATRQAAYFASHGHYFQGLWSHSVIPTDGQLVNPDFQSKPTDQTDGWLDFDPTLSGAKWPASIKIDVYEGPGGHGYVVTAKVEVGGQIYSKSINYGSELYRSHDWIAEASEATP